jgi:hypothetical protein
MYAERHPHILRLRRGREVIAAARKTADAIGAAQVRVVFIVPTRPGE